MGAPAGAAAQEDEAEEEGFARPEETGGHMKFYKVPEIAEILRCSESTIYALLEKGEMIGHRCPGWRVRQDDLDGYLEKTRREPEPVQKRTGPRTLKHVKI